MEGIKVRYVPLCVAERGPHRMTIDGTDRSSNPLCSPEAAGTWPTRPNDGAYRLRFPHLIHPRPYPPMPGASRAHHCAPRHWELLAAVVWPASLGRSLSVTMSPCWRYRVEDKAWRHK